MPQTAKAPPLMLNSWKEIATYLDRGVRTVQRWERELQLPVHRIGNGRRSPVYATSAELNLWIATAGVERASRGLLPPPNRSGRPIEESHRLLSNFHSLVGSVAHNAARHREQAEILESRILQMRSRIKGGGLINR